MASSWLTALVDRASQHLPVAWADSAPFRAVGVGPTPIPEHVPEIRMLREEVDIHLFSRAAVVEASFELRNEGHTTTIPVGFPLLGKPRQFAGEATQLLNFEASVDGAVLSDTQEESPNEDYPTWRVWEQTFTAGTTTRLDVRYRTALHDYAGISRIPYVYVLRTGRYWKGSIGEAIVRVHAREMPLEAIREAHPDGHVADPTARTLTWSFRDLDPEEDIGFLISPGAITAAKTADAEQLGELRDPVELVEDWPDQGTNVVTWGRDPSLLTLDTVLEQGWLDRVAELKDQQGDITLEATRATDSIDLTLLSERANDHNIVLPDGIAALPGERKAIERLAVQVHVPGGTPCHVLSAPTHWRGWISRLVVRGHVVASAARMPRIVASDVFRVLDRGVSLDGIRDAFPWVGQDPSQVDWGEVKAPDAAWQAKSSRKLWRRKPTRSRVDWTRS